MIGLALSLWLRDDWPVAGLAVLLHACYVVAALPHVPVAFRRAPDRDVGLAVAVVVAGHRHVSGQAPSLRHHTAVLAALDQPLARCAAIDRYVVFAIAVIIARHDHVVVGIVLRAPLRGLQLA